MKDYPEFDYVSYWFEVALPEWQRFKSRDRATALLALEIANSSDVVQDRQDLNALVMNDTVVHFMERMKSAFTGHQFKLDDVTDKMYELGRICHDYGHFYPASDINPLIEAYKEAAKESEVDPSYRLPGFPDGGKFDRMGAGWRVTKLIYTLLKLQGISTAGSMKKMEQGQRDGYKFSQQKIEWKKRCRLAAINGLPEPEQEAPKSDAAIVEFFQDHFPRGYGLWPKEINGVNHRLKDSVRTSSHKPDHPFVIGRKHMANCKNGILTGHEAPCDYCGYDIDEHISDKAMMISRHPDVTDDQLGVALQHVLMTGDPPLKEVAEQWGIEGFAMPTDSKIKPPTIDLSSLKPLQETGDGKEKAKSEQEGGTSSDQKTD